MDDEDGEGKHPRRRGRGPSPAKTAETRRMLLAAALELFLDRGFANTRMGDVAERASLGKGTLYLHFADKEALFEGVLRQAMQQPLAQFGQVAPAPGEPVRAFLSRTVTPVLRNLERSPRAGIIRMIVTEGGRFPAIARIYRQAVLDPAAGIIRSLAERAAEQGELRSAALSRHPLLLVAPGVLATLWNGLYGMEEPMDTAEVFEAFLDLLFATA